MERLQINESMKPYIKKINPLQYLQEDEIEDFMDLITVHRYIDEVIIKQGVVEKSLYAVLKGSVKVTVDNQSGESYICTLGASEIFGEAGLFLNAKRTANVVAMDKAIVLRISRKNMLKFVNKHPIASNKIFMIMIYSLLQKLKEANRELAYERKSDFNQADIDSLINNLLTNE
ncbi:cyclic nucleotide-binding domain-containing protein [Thiospirochaeta perfilievii]|uniref:Cyclic nucleotide-binding domain-containing protein n=1 Tax=Thiospirochaeta perfilievii TaxID=252967 RepID=A0A5C1QCQ5_9SPIO|nr:cyclic nucleotide-binding domain-containing protein [Thiospirochaeta perfilievii]QEN05118.1 cyclic nucleotide-binding domain-containing protein [Thiospirochaeta perfilievii]